MGRSDKTEAAAALMVLLGEDAAADVLKHLDDEEAQQVSSAIGRVEGTADRYVESLGQLLDLAEEPSGTTVGS